MKKTIRTRFDHLGKWVLMLAISALLFTACGGGTSGTSPIQVANSAKLLLFSGSLGGVGTLDGIGNAARIDKGILSTDLSGNIYLTQPMLIRQITPTGRVKTIAGSTTPVMPTDCGSFCIVDGLGEAARFDSAGSTAIDSKGNIYVVDNGNLREITQQGMVSTLIKRAINSAPSARPNDGPISSATFNWISHVSIDAKDNIYLVDNSGYVRKLSTNGIVSTLNPDIIDDGRLVGSVNTLKFSEVRSIKIDSADNIYIAEGWRAVCQSINCYVSGNADIRKITPDGTVSIVLKDSSLASVTSMAIEKSGSILFAAGQGCDDYPSAEQCILYRVNATGSVLQIANNTRWVTIDKSGVIYTLAQDGSEISLQTEANATVIAGLKSHTGKADGLNASFAYPSGITSDSAGSLYVSDQFDSLRKISPSGEVSTLSINPTYSFSYIGINSFGGIYTVGNGNMVMTRVPDGATYLLAGSLAGRASLDGKGIAASFSDIGGIAVDTKDNVYVSDNTSRYSSDGGSTIRKIVPDGTVTTIAGSATLKGAKDGDGLSATFNDPTGIAADKAGNIYVCDTKNQLIRKISTMGLVSTIAGIAGVRGSMDGPASTATFNNPQGIAIDKNGALYIADTDNHTIRRVGTDGYVTTIIGKAGQMGVATGLLPASLSLPSAITVMPNGQLAIVGENSILVTVDGKF